MRFVTALAGICLAVLAACSPAEEKQKKEIRAAVTPASPPNLYDDKGKTVGLDLELIEGYCKARGCTIRLTPYDWQGMLGAVVSGQADIAFSGISITDQRKEVMDFSVPYMDNTWNLVSLKDRNIRLDSLGDLKKYSIGYPRGMAYSDFIRKELEPRGLYSLDKVKLYPSYNEVLADLQNGNLDLAFLDGTVASVYRKTMPIQDAYVFTGFDRFGFAFPKGSKLREDVDKYLTQELKPEERQAIIDKWLK
ncbi:transporter substrate-binding domain-containing protein [Camelimonas abortus]|uniref:Transporter substrate-binding domain-containing protein n=1 Tax=Camelimonas abortus TaxID=1017184 RepID=A0ABV7LBH8_9HYPH